MVVTQRHGAHVRPGDKGHVPAPAPTASAQDNDGIPLPEPVRERLRAEVVHWGVQQAPHRLINEQVLQDEYDRRLQAARTRARAIEDAYQRRLRQADEQLRSSRDEQRKALFDSMLAAVPPPSHEQRSALTRRNALRALGLVGVPAAVAFGAVKAAQPAPSVPSQALVADANALGGSGGFGGEPDPTLADHPRLAAEAKDASVYGPFHGPTKNPWPQHLDRLFPPPPRRARQGRVRTFTLTAKDAVLEVAAGVKYAGWTYDGTIPGPVIRVTQGDTVRVTLKNQGSHPHSIHFHGVHPSNQDGVFQAVAPGGTGTYEFVAEPFGVFPYHCHTEPIDQHIFRGLYGVMIIDPPEPRPVAKEMVMLMNGYDTNFDKENELYSINGLPGYYYDNPIQLKRGQLNRIYLVNMTEFDPVNSLHMHANMFNWIPAGTSLEPSYLHDVVHLGVGDRGIMEFTYRFPGTYMIHAHQNELTVHGWQALFRVL